MPVLHDLHSILQADVIGPHSLRLVFEDGIVRSIDLGAVLAGELYGPLADVDFFKRVRLDPEVHTIEWPNGADFDPETLYNWDLHFPAWEAAAERWRREELEVVHA